MEGILPGFIAYVKRRLDLFILSVKHHADYEVIQSIRHETFQQLFLAKYGPKT